MVLLLGTHQKTVGLLKIFSRQTKFNTKLNHLSPRSFGDCWYIINTSWYRHTIRLPETTTYTFLCGVFYLKIKTALFLVRLENILLRLSSRFWLSLLGLTIVYIIAPKLSTGFSTVLTCNVFYNYYYYVTFCVQNTHSLTKGGEYSVFKGLRDRWAKLSASRGSQLN